jgi:hypothetical protein
MLMVVFCNLKFYTLIYHKQLMEYLITEPPNVVLCYGKLNVDFFCLRQFNTKIFCLKQVKI